MSPYSMPVLNKNIVSVFQENLPHFCKEFVNYHMLVHTTEEENFPVLE